MTAKKLFQHFKGVWPKWSTNSLYIISPNKHVIVNVQGTIHISQDMEKEQHLCQTLYGGVEFDLDEDNKMMVLKDFMAIKYE